MRALSLFAGVGVAETFLAECGIQVRVANEIDPVRAQFYRWLYPHAQMITGDITDTDVFAEVLRSADRAQVNLVLATPPCQGMSLAGKRSLYDERNQLISYVVKAIQALRPQYALIENVPQILQTPIHVQGNTMLVPEYLQRELGEDYHFADQSLVWAMDYGVPQTRRRNIFLLSRKDLAYAWKIPAPQPRINLRKVLYHLPSVDPMLREGIDETLRLFPDFFDKMDQAVLVSKFHRPPVHAQRHVIAMMHTPTGESALNNHEYYPQKSDGKRVQAHDSTYRRLEWDRPARTITQNNGIISSFCCVHPGKGLGRDRTGERIYSDARCLTIYELLLVSSLPPDWNIPDWADDRLIRQVIGEGVPPMLIKNLALELMHGVSPIA